MLRAIDQDLWVAEQPLKYFGLEVGTRMTIVRLQDGRLIVISPIASDDAMIQQLNQLGVVSDIVAPNLYHHLFLAQFKQRYPHAKLWATSGLEQKCPNLLIDQYLSEQTIGLLDEIEAVPVSGFNTFDIKGYSPLNEWVFFHSKSRTLIVTDLAFYLDGHSSLTTQLISRLFGVYGQLRPSWLERIATRDKARVKQSIQHILTWEFERVIMAHGRIVERNGKRQFQQGYEWFLGSPLSSEER